MNAVQAVILVCGSLGLATAMIAMMIRANRSERRSIERRREGWIAGGCIPEGRSRIFFRQQRRQLRRLIQPAASLHNDPMVGRRSHSAPREVDHSPAEPLPERAPTRPAAGVGRASSLPRPRRRPHQLALPNLRRRRLRTAAQHPLQRTRWGRQVRLSTQRTSAT
jgi:hypothetical protein